VDNDFGIDFKIHSTDGNSFLNNDILIYILQGKVDGQTNFMFKGTSLQEIVFLFKDYNYQISGGYNIPILSPVHLRQGKFISCVESIYYNKAYESFNLLYKWRTNVKPELTQQDYDKWISDRIRL